MKRFQAKRAAKIKQGFGEYWSKVFANKLIPGIKIEVTLPSDKRFVFDTCEDGCHWEER